MTHISSLYIDTADICIDGLPPLIAIRLGKSKLYIPTRKIDAAAEKPMRRNRFEQIESAFPAGLPGDSAAYQLNPREQPAYYSATPNVLGEFVALGLHCQSFTDGCGKT